MVDMGARAMSRGGEVGESGWGGVTCGLGVSVGDEVRAGSADMGVVVGATVVIMGEWE